MLHVPLMGDGPGLICPLCQVRYPLVHGIPVVAKDPQRFVQAQGERLNGPPDLRFPAEPCELRERVQAWLSELDGDLLDLGCGAGLHGDARVVGLDNDAASLRHYPGPRVLGDAHDPPWGPRSFDAVLLLNLLDSCRNPRLVLAQADTLLRATGVLLISCAFAFADHITDEHQRFTADQLLASLGGDRSALGLSFDYALEVHDPVSWRLRSGPRTVHEFQVQLIRATRRA
jgi:SAM-dependent methyltransferase